MYKSYCEKGVIHNKFGYIHCRGKCKMKRKQQAQNKILGKKCKFGGGM